MPEQPPRAGGVILVADGAVVVEAQRAAAGGECAVVAPWVGVPQVLQQRSRDGRNERLHGEEVLAEDGGGVPAGGVLGGPVAGWRRWRRWRRCRCRCRRRRFVAAAAAAAAAAVVVVPLRHVERLTREHPALDEVVRDAACRLLLREVARVHALARRAPCEEASLLPERQPLEQRRHRGLAAGEQLVGHAGVGEHGEADVLQGGAELRAEVFRRHVDLGDLEVVVEALLAGTG